MDKSDYKKALDAAHAEIAGLMHQRDEIDKKMSQLKAAADSLSAVLDAKPKLDEITSYAEVLEMGISDAIRHILKSSQVPLTPREIKTKLVEGGFDITIYVNPGAVIFNTLKRLEDQEEITHFVDKAKNLIGYTYIHTPATALEKFKRAHDKRFGKL
jgi:hypothetical protein